MGVRPPTTVPLLTEPRVHSTERDVIVLQGSPGYAASTFFHGKVVVSLSEPVTIKRVTLRLYGTLRLSWFDLSAAAKTGSSKPVKYEKVIYEHEWNNLETASRGSGYTTPVSGSSSHVLPAGNHEFPFEVIIPGSIDESVEGLEDAQVVYKLVATIERGRFANNFVSKKHLRVIRTLGPDELELNQTMCIENTWPNKVQYSVSIPTKAIAIGTFTHISFAYSPLLKGLTLGKTKIQLVSCKSLSTGTGLSKQAETIISEVIMSPPPDGFLGQDEWTCQELFRIPSSLTKCTQDCQIESHIKVTHKFRFSIGLVNPDGHVSELRASVPISLFISPNVTITSREPEEPSSRRSYLSSHHEQQLFTPHQATEVDEHAGHIVKAPPSYHDHIYDALWGEIPSPHLNTPLASGTSTPLHDGDHQGLATTRLLSNLYALQERQNSGSGDDDLYSSASSSRSPYAPHVPPSIMIHSCSPSGANTPRGTGPGYGSTLPIPIAINGLMNSMVDSQHGSSGGSPGDPVSLAMLSKVPSYNTAVASEPGECTPTYDESTSPSSPVTRPHSLLRQQRQLSGNGGGSLSNLNAFFTRHKKQNASGTQLSSLSYHISKAATTSPAASGNTPSSPGTSAQHSSSGSGSSQNSDDRVSPTSSSSSMSTCESPNTTASSSPAYQPALSEFSTGGGSSSGSRHTSVSAGGHFFKTSSKSHVAHITERLASNTAAVGADGADSEAKNFSK